MVIDGIIGIGGKGGLRGAAAEAADAVAGLAERPIVVSVDVPSGVDVDTGAVEGQVIRADVTVTFGCLKPALVVGPAAPYAGQVDLVDIGLPWLAAVADLTPSQTISAGLNPFVLWDGIKLAVAAGIFPVAWWLIGRRPDDR